MKLSRKKASMSSLLLLFAACLMLTVFGSGGSGRSRADEGNNVLTATTDKLANGVWGGEHIRAEVTDAGAEIEFDCAHGTISQTIVLSSTGSFEVTGKYSPQHGGPVRDDEDSSLSVRYVGGVKDKAMSLKIINRDTKETIGDFTLTHESEGRVFKCR